MVTPVFWCPHCRIPIIKNEICPLCGTATKPLSTTGVCNPVFAQEKKLNANELIQQSIKGDVAQLLELFKQLKKSNLSSLSTAQIKYIDYLKQRYNNYSVYFE